MAKKILINKKVKKGDLSYFKIFCKAVITLVILTEFKDD